MWLVLLHRAVHVAHLLWRDATDNSTRLWKHWCSCQSHWQSLRWLICLRLRQLRDWLVEDRLWNNSLRRQHWNDRWTRLCNTPCSSEDMGARRLSRVEVHGIADQTLYWGRSRTWRQSGECNVLSSSQELRWIHPLLLEKITLHRHWNCY